MTTKTNLNKRWLYLVSGVFTMLFSGVLYAWSILKIPFKSDFNWSDSILAFNFTFTLCFFCVAKTLVEQSAFARLQASRGRLLLERWA